MPKWSQHFLIDPGVAHDILDHAHLTLQDVVLEIGPGRGALTELILPRVRSLLAIEIDPVLSAELRRRWVSVPQFNIITGDFLRTNLDALVPPHPHPLPPGEREDTTYALSSPPFKVMGNLPYAVTAPILQRLLPWSGWSEATLMMQREVAERLTSPPGRRAYGLLTVATQLYATPTFVSVVPPAAFQPIPQVESAILRLRRHPPLAPPAVIDRALHLAKTAFHHRRKTLLNAFSPTSKSDLLRTLERLGIDPKSRPEDLRVEDFLRLARTPVTSLIPRRKNAIHSA
ncbi:MAG: ribosomal RNA small subunit methyltransferase A [Elusimicrobia bacterium]|nr:ribosomal RNA small subunit methyltransferase A [Elusimicrobiota bacterium]